MKARAYYQNQIDLFSAEQQKLRKELLILSLLRLLAFVGIILGAFKSFSQLIFLAYLVIPSLIAFVFLLNTYAKKKAIQKYQGKRIQLCKNELLIADGKFQDFPDGAKYKDPLHEYSEDLDLFGRNSFFQYTNRTQTPEGETCYANLLKANDSKDILEKQEAIKELAAMVDWRMDYATTAALIDAEKPVGSIISWLKTYSPFTKKYFRWLPKGFLAISLLIVILVSQNILPALILAAWISLGLVLSLRLSKKVQQLMDSFSKHHESLAQYAKLLEKIEKAEFTSSFLQTQQERLQSSQTSASGAVADLAKKLQLLEHSNNLLIKIFANAIALYDLWMSYPVEDWIKEYTDEVGDWLEIAAFFEAQHSLASLAFNKENYTYPIIDSTSNNFIKANGLIHPLLLKEDAVPSDVHIQEGEFLIITGANMAGKSTFLRSISLAVIMANLGLPVRAKEMTYKAMPLVSSMRTTDALDEETSYFFAELKRLRYIIDKLEEKAHFVILDEILKGTNSTDKANGSARFVEKLVSLNTTGIVATHDLSLTELADKLSQVHNYFFDTQIVNNELYFDYSLKAGICRDRNATFLLEKMKIVD